MFLQEILKITFESFQIRSYIFRMEYNVAFLKKIFIHSCYCFMFVGNLASNL